MTLWACQNELQIVSTTGFEHSDQRVTGVAENVLYAHYLKIVGNDFRYTHGLIEYICIQYVNPFILRIIMASKTASTKKLSANSAYESLHARIIEGKIKPGERIREAAIVEEFGLSRTPVREALQRLESAGLLEHVPHCGMVVKQLDHQAVTELYLMREVLESTAARMAAKHASDAEIAALYDMLDEQERQYKERPNNIEAARLNKVFHVALYRGAHNRYLYDMLQTLSIDLALLGRTTLSLKDRVGESVTEHRQILDAIAAHNPEEAADAAKAHIHSAHKARLRVLFEDEQ